MPYFILQFRFPAYPTNNPPLSRTVVGLSVYVALSICIFVLTSCCCHHVTLLLKRENVLWGKKMFWESNEHLVSILRESRRSWEEQDGLIPLVITNSFPIPCFPFRPETCTLICLSVSLISAA